jgi:hypothetical protein
MNHSFLLPGIILLVTGVIAAVITAIRESGGFREVITNQRIRTAVIVALVLAGLALILVGLVF